jgi:hypothetical protein
MREKRSGRDRRSGENHLLFFERRAGKDRRSMIPKEKRKRLFWVITFRIKKIRVSPLVYWLISKPLTHPSLRLNRVIAYLYLILKNWYGSFR